MTDPETTLYSIKFEFVIQASRAQLALQKRRMEIKQFNLNFKVGVLDKRISKAIHLLGK